MAHYLRKFPHIRAFCGHVTDCCFLCGMIEGCSDAGLCAAGAGIRLPPVGAAWHNGLHVKINTNEIIISP
jgi:hypothetical protein